IVWLLDHLVKLLVGQSPTTSTTNEGEIKSLVKIGSEEGIIEADESKMIQQVFSLNDLTAEDLMTPRVRMTYLVGADRLGEVHQDIIDSQHTRIIVIGDSIDEVTGFVLKDDLLIALLNGQLNDYVGTFQRTIRFVSQAERADQLLINFQNDRQHIAVVVDEFFGIAGVVTLEDVIEVVTGEIVDETDRVIDLQEDARRRWKQRRRISLS
ncbi:MAG: HlyC/CorC family transporter, partial [Chloroflexaceae bacterium]|nr:HlyC/CorC family transporter [Chloroflexaceae bacterium]